MQKTIIGKFPPRNPQQQQQLQPRHGHGQNNLSPRESHYVILPPEEMPAADPLPISKINQEQDEGICSLSKDEPCSPPTAHMISSGSLSLISHPLSALPLQFQADPEDDDYTREAKEQAAWEAAALMEAEAALVSPGSSAMDVQHQSAKRPRSLTEDSPGREEKISAQASDLETPALLLLTNGDPEDSDQATRRRSSRFQSGSIPPPHWPPSVEGSSTVDVPICQHLADFRASLLRRMQSIFLDPCHATLRPGLEGLTSTVLTALIGLEKTLQPLYPNGGAPSSDLHSPQQQSPPLNAASPVVLSPSEKLASPTLGPHAVPPHSWAKVVARSTLPAGSSLPPLDHLLADPTNAWSPVGPRSRRERKQRIGTGPVVTPSPLSANRGPTPPAGPRWNNGLSSPPERKSGAVAGGTSFAQDLRAVRLTPLSQEEQARTLQQLLFAPPPSDAAMDTEGPSGSRRSRDEPVAFLHVECPNFSAAARKEPKAAWRHLLLSLSKEGSPPLRPLDILPMSATKAEIFIPEAQLPTYRAALQTYVLTDPSPLTERDFRRRAAAYRNSYYRAYRQATLRGFPDKHLQFDLLVHIQTDAYTPSPPPTKYKDILRMVEMDLKALQDPLPAAPREA